MYLYRGLQHSCNKCRVR